MVTFRCWGDLQKTLDKLKNVSTGTLWNSERQTETLTAGKEKSLATAQSEQWAAGQQLCRKGPGHPGGLHMSPVCPGSKLGTAPGLHRAMPRGDLSTSSALVRPHRSCTQNWLPQNKTNWSKFRKEPPRQSGQSISPGGEAEGTGFMQPGERQTSAKWLSSISY